MNDIAQIEGCINRYEVFRDFFNRNGIIYGINDK